MTSFYELQTGVQASSLHEKRKSGI